MAKKENRFKDYDITTQAIHTGTDYDAETGAVRRPLHMANSYKLPDDLCLCGYIKSRGRLIRQQKLGMKSYCHSNTYPLAHTTRKLEGI